ncbi:MAG: MDR family MFS transporter [Anaerolineae bacterium]
MQNRNRSPSSRENIQATNRITGSRRWWALAAVLITIFFGSLDQTVVSTAMPVIIGDLKGFDIYAWVFTAYLITSAVTVPIYGKLSDVYGRKPFYVFGLSVFIVGSALSGQSHTMLELIAYRGLQGIGAGAMLSMPRATIGDIFNPRERGRWMGVISMTFGPASIVGPFLGGWITDTLGWPWVFYINLPVAGLALVGTLYALPRVRTEHQVQVDWAGSALLVIGLIPMLLAFTWAGSTYPWASPINIGLFAFSLIMLVLFAWVETQINEPIIPTSFFEVPIFATANLIGLLLSVGMFGTLLFLPLYVQGVLGLSAQSSGAIMTPMMLSFIVAALIAGQIMTRTGRYKLISLLAALLMSVGLYLFTRLDVNSSWTTVVRDMLIMGVGIGALLPILNVAVQNAFPYRVMGVVNATQQFVRSLGAVIAAPILGTVLANTFAAHMKLDLPPALKDAIANLPASTQQAFSDPQSLTNAQTQAAIRAKFDAFGSAGDKLYHQFIAVVHESLAVGMERLFLIAFFFGLAALFITFLLPEIPLKHDEFFEETDGG